LEVLGHNMMHTISKRRVAIPARHKTSPIIDPTKNRDEINDNAAIKNKTIWKYLILPPIII
jgi:hypothetical protein